MKKQVIAVILIIFFFPLAAFAASGTGVAEDDTAFGRTAWDEYNKGDYSSAYDAFTRLLENRPDNEDYSLGLAYSALKLGRLDDALRIAKALGGRKSDFIRIKLDIYGRKGSAAFEKKDYKEASFFLGKVHEAMPDDAGTGELLAWSLYNEGRLEEALRLFEGLYAKTKDLKFAEMIMIIYDRTGDSRGAYAFARGLATGDEKQRTMAADHLFKIGCPTAAAETFNRSGACFYNANSPWLVFSPAFRYKSGAEGTSKVMQRYAVLGYSHPFGYGHTLSLSITPGYITSGKAPSMPFAGSFFNSSNGQKNGLTTSVSSIEPRITLEKEAGVIYTFSAGTTPIGGEMPSLPVFLVSVKNAHWSVGLHQSSVDESLLSYTGLKDPYSDDKWGRVVKTGAEAGYAPSVFSPYWLSLKAGYDYYRGGNVLENREYAGTAAFGRTFQTGDWDASAGVFASAKGFKYNTNFFTFGHGGYFSPQSFLAAGPVLRLRTRPCRTYFLDAEFGLNYLNYRTNDAKRYPLEKTGGQSAEVFNGGTFSGAGYSASIEGIRLIQRRLAVGGSFRIDRSADYTEWKAAAELKVFFEPREAVVYY